VPVKFSHFIYKQIPVSWECTYTWWQDRDY